MNFRKELGCAISLSGVLVVFLPLLIATAGNPSGGCSESTGSCAVIWLMFISIPAGFMLGIVGIWVMVRNRRDRGKGEK